MGGRVAGHRGHIDNVDDGVRDKKENDKGGSGSAIWMGRRTRNNRQMHVQMDWYVIILITEYTTYVEFSHDADANLSES